MIDISDVGEAFVDIRADDTKLTADLLELRAKILAELLKIEKNSTIAFKAKTSDVEKALARVRTEISKIKIEDLKVQANTKQADEKILRLHTALRELAKVRPEITPRVEDTIAKGKITDLIALGKELGAQRPSMKIVLDGEEALLTKLATIKAAAGDLDTKRVSIHVGVDGEAVALTKMEALKAAVGSINDFSEQTSKRGLIGALGVTGLIGGLAAAGIVIDAFGVKAVASLEQVRIGFEGVLGDKGVTGDFIDQMRQFAAITPFEFDEVTESAQRLIGTFGKGFREDVIPTLTTIGDVAATLGQGAESIDRVVKALSRIEGKGKLTARELNSISEALPGFQSRAAIAAGLFGVSVNSVTAAQLQQASALTTEGAVGSADAIRFLLAAMEEFPGAAGAMERQSATLNGRLSTLKDTVKILAQDAFLPLAGVVKSATDSLIAAVGGGGEIGAAVTALGSSSADALSGIISGVLGSVSPGAEAISNTIVTIGNAVEQLLPKVATALVPITEILEHLADTGVDAFGTLLDVAIPVLETVSDVLNAIPTEVLDTLLAGYLAFKAVAAIQGVFEGVAAKILALDAQEALAVGTNAAYAASFEAIDAAMAQAVVASEAIGTELVRLDAELFATIDAELETSAATTTFTGSIAALEAELALLGGQLLSTDAALAGTSGTAAAASSGLATVAVSAEAAAGGVGLLGSALLTLGTGVALAPVVFALGTILSFFDDLKTDQELIAPAFEAASRALETSTLALSKNSAALEAVQSDAEALALAYKTVADAVGSITFNEPDFVTKGVLATLNPFDPGQVGDLRATDLSVADSLLNLEVQKKDLFLLLDEIKTGGADKIVNLQKFFKEHGGVDLFSLGFTQTGSLRQDLDPTEATNRISQSIATLENVVISGGNKIDDVLRPALKGIKVDGDDASKAALALAQAQLGFTNLDTFSNLLPLYIQYTQNLVDAKGATDELDRATSDLTDRLANDVDVEKFAADLDKIKDSGDIAAAAMTNLKNILEQLSGTPISLAEQASEIQKLFDALHVQEQATDPITGKRLTDDDGNPILVVKNRINKAFTTDQFAAAGPLSTPQTQENLAALIQFGQAFQQQAIDKITKGGEDAGQALNEYALALSFLRNEFGEAGISASEFDDQVTALGLDPIIIKISLDAASKEAVLEEIGKLGEDTPPEIIAILTAEANTGSVSKAAAEMQALADLTPAELAVFVADTAVFGVQDTLNALVNPDGGYVANIDARLEADTEERIQTSLDNQLYSIVVDASVNTSDVQEQLFANKFGILVQAQVDTSSLKNFHFGSVVVKEAGDHVTRFFRDGGSTMAGALAQQVPHRTNIQRTIYGEPSTHGEYFISMAPGHADRNEDLIVAAANEMGRSAKIADRLIGTPGGGGATVVDLGPMMREIASLRKALLTMPPITVMSAASSPEAHGSAVYWANRNRAGL